MSCRLDKQKRRRTEFVNKIMLTDLTFRHLKLLKGSDLVKMSELFWRWVPVTHHAVHWTWWQLHMCTSNLATFSESVTRHIHKTYSCPYQGSLKGPLPCCVIWLSDVVTAVHVSAADHTAGNNAAINTRAGVNHSPWTSSAYRLQCLHFLSGQVFVSVSIFVSSFRF